MISFLSSPKAFIGETGVIQRNAIRSWQNVHPDAEITIYGNSTNAYEVCEELGVCCVSDVLCSPSGVPYFNSIVEHARIHARHDVQCYLNCDILMTKDMIKAVSCIDFPRYLVVGQRLDLVSGVQIDTTSNKLTIDLQKLNSKNKVSLHGSTGMDYFIFPRGMWEALPPLVIGRGGYDGALLAFCLRNKIPMVNATLAFPALHQFHDYGHVPGGLKTVIEGRDAKNNLLLHNIKHSTPNSADAPWLIVNGALIPNSIQKDWLRRIELTLRFDMKIEALSLAVRLLWRIAMATGIIKPRPFTIKDVISSTMKV